ncbi:MAG: CopG family antitoxin [Candidatus Poribacteria bacterium]
MEKKIPQFKSLEEEMEFWDTHSVTEFEAQEVTVEEILEELKHRSAKTKVTLRLEMEMQNQLKALAAKQGVSYSSLIYKLLRQGLEAASAETQSAVSKR